jgi:hypothetical protein
MIGGAAGGRNEIAHPAAPQGEAPRRENQRGAAFRPFYGELLRGQGVATLNWYVPSAPAEKDVAWIM